ncbi:hypothetical protein EVAR_62843_1 [Eumeta japonica]|uniref:Uncharacterized protein n=1 Tax=Eumeta variegata TaxID=151549 RepID=A0A4C1ZF35_EUMVA|nr:hypothetical protein EVAR_62843_1 [Eumeta japonica]
MRQPDSHSNDSNFLKLTSYARSEFLPRKFHELLSKFDGVRARGTHYHIRNGIPANVKTKMTSQYLAVGGSLHASGEIQRIGRPTRYPFIPEIGLRCGFIDCECE